MTNSEAILLGQMITESKRDIMRVIREHDHATHRGFQHLSRRMAAMEESRSSLDISRLEKWLVRGATIGLPTATFILTGSMEKAWQVLQGISHFMK